MARAMPALAAAPPSSCRVSGRGAAADSGNDELAGGRLADDVHFAFDDHIDTVGRLAAAHEVLARIEPDGTAGERQELELGGIEAPEKGHLPQHFRFLKYIHFEAS